MLEELHIKNFVLIDELNLSFQPGLNVLSGETGAGKSIIVDAVSLLSGDRWQAEYTRNPEQAVIVEAVFNIENNSRACLLLQNNGFVEDPTEPLIISRLLQPGGRSWARINGQITPLKFLRELSRLLLDMHGQEERLKIFTPENYLSYVDAYAKEIKPLKAKLKQKFDELEACKKTLAKSSIDENERLQQIDFLNFQIREIEQAHLQPGEDEELQNLKQRITGAADLKTATTDILYLLHENPQQLSAGDMLYDAYKAATKANQEPVLQKAGSQLENIYYEIQEIIQEISHFQQQLDFNPQLLEETENRLHQIYRLTHKYGGNVADVLEYLETAVQKREKLLNSARDREALQTEIKALTADCLELAHNISRLRQPAAIELQNRILTEAGALELKDLRFEIKLQTEEDLLSNTGIDKAHFLFSANPGENLIPVERSASGGEKSRFILAFKKALADQYRTETLIFDEIDAGLGGTALKAMATQLKLMSETHQILLVTHAAQIAAHARQHFYIEKTVKDGQTFTHVTSLQPAEREREIARMLGGADYSDITLEHARELLENASD